MLKLKIRPDVTSRFWRLVAWLCLALTVIAVVNLLLMMLLTCLDVLMRASGLPLKGSYDLVKIAGAITVACSLPVTTAMKGHVAIEYFFQRLRRRWRLRIDSLMRLLMIIGFGLAACESVICGRKFLETSQVTDTIGLPIFWVPWLMAGAFVVTALVVLFQLIYPRRELVHL